MRFAICLDNEGYEASLELRKLYQVLTSERNDPKDYIRRTAESAQFDHDLVLRYRGASVKHLPWVVEELEKVILEEAERKKEAELTRVEEAGLRRGDI